MSGLFSHLSETYPRWPLVEQRAQFRGPQSPAHTVWSASAGPAPGPHPGGRAAQAPSTAPQQGPLFRCRLLEKGFMA